MSYGDSKIGTPWRGYYITAYGIAVKHGFKGTEEEWLASLQGADGRSIEIRYNDVTNVLEWKFTDDDAWTQLLDLEQLQTEIVAQTLAQAQAAQQAAEAAQAAAEAAQQEAERNAGVTQADASITQTNVQLSQDAKTAAQAAQEAAEAARQAAETAQAAAETAETGAEESATLSKSWAVGGTGTRPGEDTNNAEYWAGQAAAAAGGGVISFNGRTGTVLPQEGDYDANKVGAANKALSNLDTPQLALKNLGAAPQKSFADNARFAKAFLVNQRGQADYTVDDFHKTCIDRWKMLGKMTLEEKWISIQKTQLAPEFFVQAVSDEVLSALRGKTVTLSAVYNDGTRKIAGSTFVVPEQGDIDSPEAAIGDVSFDLYKSSGDATARIRFFSSSSTTTIKLEAVELVPGNNQTVVYEDGNGDLQFIDTTDYGEELARCQRYGIPVSGGRYIGNNLGNRAIVFIPTPVTMRAKPAIQVSNYGGLVFSSGETKTPTSIEVESVESNGIKCAVNYSDAASGSLVELSDLAAFISAEL